MKQNSIAHANTKSNQGNTVSDYAKAAFESMLNEYAKAVQVNSQQPQSSDCIAVAIAANGNGSNANATDTMTGRTNDQAH